MEYTGDYGSKELLAGANKRGRIIGSSLGCVE